MIFTHCVHCVHCMRTYVCMHMCEFTLGCAPPKYPLIKNNLVKTLVELKKEYTISFESACNVIRNLLTQSVILFTTGG